MLQLNPPIPVMTPSGEGLVHVLRDYEPNSGQRWPLLINQAEGMLTYANRQMRSAKEIGLRCAEPRAREDALARSRGDRGLPSGGKLTSAGLIKKARCVKRHGQIVDRTTTDTLPQWHSLQWPWRHTISKKDKP